MQQRRKNAHVSGQNALLSALAGDAADRVLARAARVSLPLKALATAEHSPIPFVYFPINCVFSLLVVMSNGLAVEAATIGNEGFVGHPLFLGTDVSPYRAFAQIPGDAWRISAEDFVDEVRTNEPLRAVVGRYSQALSSQMAFSVACNRLHSIEERMCRWLLMTHDRVGEDRFPLTQEFLSQMLGVRRPSVTVVAGVLQKAGLISYTRGWITVLDRVGLETASCECYRVVRDEFDRLLG